MQRQLTKNQPIDVDALVERFERERDDPNADIAILTSANAVHVDELEREIAADRRARGRADFIRRTFR